MKNIFDYATKELSQDAFLRWLFENYNCEIEGVKAACRTLFKEITNRNGLSLDFDKIEALETVAQWKKIDVSIWFKIGEEEYLIVIEDKTNSEEHDQLKEYNKKIEEHNDYWSKVEKPNPAIRFLKNKENLFRVFYKTAEITKKERMRVQTAGWNIIFDIKKIQDIWRKVDTDDCELLKCYAAHIEKIYKSHYEYKKLDFKTEWRGNNTAFLSYANEKFKDFTNKKIFCYRGIFTVAEIIQFISDFTMILRFEFRREEIKAVILYSPQNNEKEKIKALQNKMNAINLSSNEIFRPDTKYGKKRLALDIKQTLDEIFFKNYEEFDVWVSKCLNEYQKITEQVQKGSKNP